MFTYVLLSLPPIQRAMCDKAQTELSKLLDTQVTVDNLAIAPFNRITLRGVTIMDNKSDTIATIHRLGAGIDPLHAIMSGQISIDYTELVALNLRLKKDTKDSPLNIDHIVKALSSKDPNKPKTEINIDIKTVVIRNSIVSYDILDMPRKQNVFDPNHISVNDFRADITIPKITNSSYVVSAKRISLLESSGLNVSDLHADVDINTTDSVINVSNIALQLQETKIELQDICFKQSSPLNIATKSGSVISLADFAPFVPQLANVPMPINADIDITLDNSLIDIKKIRLNAENGEFDFDAKSSIYNPSKLDSLEISDARIELRAASARIIQILSQFAKLSPKVVYAINAARNVKLQTKIQGTPQNARVDGKIITNIGNLDYDIKPQFITSDSTIVLKNVNYDINAENLNLASILSNKDFGIASFQSEGSYSPSVGHTPQSANISLNIVEAYFKNYLYSDVNATAQLNGKDINADIDIQDKNIDLTAELIAQIEDKTSPKAYLNATINKFNPHKLNLTSKYPNHELSANINATIAGNNIDDAIATLEINDLNYYSPTEPSLKMDNLTFTLDTQSSPSQLHLNSDFLSADMEGEYTLSSIPTVIKDIAAQSFSNLITLSKKETEKLCDTDLTLAATIKYSDNLNKFLNLPVTIIYPITINSTLSAQQKKLSLDVSAPYLQQKDKLIENTSLHIATNDEGQSASLCAVTNVPTKNGAMNLNLQCNAANNRLDTQVAWHIDRKRLYQGNIDLSALFSKEEETGNLAAQVDINPSKMTFNDTTWTVNPATIIANKDKVIVQNFDVRRENQYVTMQGTASQDPEDVLTLNLLNVNLDYIFESLGIDKAQLGGDATGTFYATNLFTPQPSITTPDLHVKNISYNKTVFGDADIKSRWDNDKKEITLDADIISPDKTLSTVTGGIFPLNDSLDITFNAKDINVKFLKPYMEAFTSDIEGTASGRARLFGTFKYIDLEGDIFANNLKLKIDFTNTTYTATDSVHIRPGKIKIDKIKLYDREGNTAYLKGEVRHKFFKEPEFDFYITDAKNFLSYDITSKQNPDWYGTIYGTGGATITGVPGVVNIYVDMTTAPKSTFTFVLSDQQTASEYSFISFRDRNKKETVEADTTQIPVSKLIQQLKERMSATQESEPSVYNMTLQVNVTPEAQLILVMDPVGGDKIKANGTGNLRMDYGSANEDLRMYGKYTLDKGSYNFTLQDIIIKDFIIKQGSTISFNGDPYAAQLDLNAYYALNANLSDLDESFLQDKDLNRTNVPVHAMMNVTSDIRSPEIKFDLEFPTLTSDTYRKVKSIISTEDMMNRQIIYLLALNRFYTPDYMGATTKGNELVSVASSTISSQLSSMLGQLSDNWTIAPNFRSDKGDFSDVEVDLALSSTLLNNRLLFNGNFGYRDNSLNSNQFIGDFDLEYLLNKSGSLRLKAYNRYNDQNFYVKTATTTQGIGIVYRRDFDHVLSFLYRLKEKRKAKQQAQQKAKLAQDSIKNDISNAKQSQ